MPYDFTQDGFRKFSEAILAAGGDQATLTTHLADMQSTFETNIGNLANINKTLTETTEENDRLRKANLDLFLRIGADPKEKPATQETGEQPEMDCSQYMKNYFEKEGQK